MKTLLLASAALALGPIARASELPVTPATIAAVARTAHPGDALLLAPGAWPASGLWGSATSLQFPAPGITLKPADPNHAPVLAAFTLSNVQNVHAQGLEIAAGGPGTAVTVIGASHISLAAFSVHGASAGLGVMIRASADVTFSGGEIHHFKSGLSLVEPDGVTIVANSIHDLQTDGLLLAGAQHVEIAGNSFRDFAPNAGDHPDAIQSFGTAAHPKNGFLNIHDNSVVRTAGQPPQFQGIFLANVHDVQISKNVVKGAMFNGIALADAQTATISGNYVQGYPDMNSGIVVRSADAVSVTGNQTGSIAIVPPSTNVTQAGNTIIPQAGPGHAVGLHPTSAAQR
jgi:parallel beta-helix repeat protein